MELSENQTAVAAAASVKVNEDITGISTREFEMFEMKIGLTNFRTLHHRVARLADRSERKKWNPGRKTERSEKFHNFRLDS